MIVVEPFKMSQELVMKAIENVLQNAVEAMERVPKKEISVEMEKVGDSIHVTITDTGEGIEVGDLEKVFDPFFTRRSHSKHSGLGLSATLGILSAMKGDVKISSERGKGTSVVLIFNPHAASVPLDTPDLESSPSPQVSSVNLPPPPSPLLEPIVSSAPKVREGSLSIRLRAPPRAPSQNSGLIDLAKTSSQIEVNKLDEKTASKISSLVKESAKSADPFLSDNSLEKLIESGPDAVEDISEKTIASDISIPSTLEKESMNGPQDMARKPDVKIDRPKMKPKKTSSLTDEIFVAVRKPGEKA